MKVVYTIVTSLYFFAIKIYAPFNLKASKMIEGRKNWQQSLKQKIDKNANYIWFHCASLGEFEQGRALIEMFYNQNKFKVILTFFSSSGYDVRKNYDKADIVCYLPFDKPKEVKEFYDIVNPKAAVFIKYEFWYYFLKQANKREIPIFLVSGIFRKSQIFFKPWAKFFQNTLKNFTHMFVQDDMSLLLMKKIGVDNVTVCGDTRIDRVVQIAEQNYENKFLENFVKDKFTIVAGSTWPSDEKHLFSFINKSDDKFRFIIAPHEVNENSISNIEKLTKHKTIRLSQTNLEVNPEVKLVIVDTVGILAYLYRYANLAYIGGGFGKGIHNTLEAVAYQIPVVFGPEFKKFREAIILTQKSVAYPYFTATELESIINNIYNNKKNVDMIRENAKEYISLSRGVSQLIFNKLSLIVNN